MSTGFFRSRQGREFKRTDQGDLGIRSLKEQQDQQIRAMGDVRDIALFYRRNTEGALENIGRNEIDNMRILQNLEDAAYQTRKGAVEKRKSTETQHLRDKAKQYGDKATWLQDFAPRAAKNLFTAATNVTDLYQRVEADRLYKEIIDSGEFEAGINFLNSLDDETRKEVLLGRNRAFADKDIKLSLIHI